MKNKLFEIGISTLRILSCITTMSLLFIGLFAGGLILLLVLIACYLNPILILWLLYFGVIISIPKYKKLILKKIDGWFEWCYLGSLTYFFD